MENNYPLTIACFLALLLMCTVSAHAQPPWTTGGNAASGNCFIGTTPPQPLVLKTDGVERLVVGATGGLKLSSLAASDNTAIFLLPDGSILRGAILALAGQFSACRNAPELSTRYTQGIQQIDETRTHLKNA